MKKNDIVKINIFDVSVDGKGIGKTSDGAVVFCKGLLTDDVAKVKIIKKVKNYYIAIPHEIEQRSENYRQAKCPYFGKCGGCTIQHMYYDNQLDYKTKRVSDSFKRIAKLDIDVCDCEKAPFEFSYRNKAVFPVKLQNNQVCAGFYRQGTHDVIDIDSCPIQNDSINTAYSIIKKWLIENKISIYNEKNNFGLIRHIYLRVSNNNQIMAGLVCTSDNVPFLDDLLDKLEALDGFANFSININNKKTNAILSNDTKTIYGKDFITHTIEDIDFSVSFQSFLQVNSKQCDKLYHKAMFLADIKPSDTVIDLFCGIGTLTLIAAKRAKLVYGIEYVKSATDNAVLNAKNNSISNAEFICGDCTLEYEKLYNKIDNLDVLIVDPPRKGLDEKLVSSILKTKPKKLVYISCDPATLARDIKLLAQDYNINTAYPFDMFSQTTHVETVISLTLK